MTQDERVLRILEDGRWHTTKDLMDLTGIWFPPRVIKSLKKKGFKIESERAEFCQKYRLNCSQEETRAASPKEVIETTIRPAYERKSHPQGAINMNLL